MTREELIEKEGEKYSEEKWKHPSSNLSRAHCSLDYMAGINSQLAKDLQELAVIEGSINSLKNVRQKFASAGRWGAFEFFTEDIDALETTRTELLTKLNLEG